MLREIFKQKGQCKCVLCFSNAYYCCSKCERMTYCSEKCYSEDEKYHKFVCQIIPLMYENFDLENITKENVGEVVRFFLRLILQGNQSTITYKEYEKKHEKSYKDFQHILLKPKFDLIRRIHDIHTFFSEEYWAMERYLDRKKQSVVFQKELISKRSAKDGNNPKRSPNEQPPNTGPNQGGGNKRSKRKKKKRRKKNKRGGQKNQPSSNKRLEEFQQKLNEEDRLRKEKEEEEFRLEEERMKKMIFEEQMKKEKEKRVYEKHVIEMKKKQEEKTRLEREKRKKEEMERMKQEKKRKEEEEEKMVRRMLRQEHLSKKKEVYEAGKSGEQVKEEPEKDQRGVVTLEMVFNKCCQIQSQVGTVMEKVNSMDRRIIKIEEFLKLKN